jgi:catechol 2,3-dioxygenase-like lactoylglutathione lyase family enzyme
MWSHGRFHWNELMARDVERAKRFYAETIGWSFTSMPMDGGRLYWCAMLDDMPVAGLFPLDALEFEGVPEGWMPVRGPTLLWRIVAYAKLPSAEARVQARLTIS